VSEAVSQLGHEPGAISGSVIPLLLVLGDVGPNELVAHGEPIVNLLNSGLLGLVLQAAYAGSQCGKGRICHGRQDTLGLGDGGDDGARAGYTPEQSQAR
jgi:hypothetical protein